MIRYLLLLLTCTTLWAQKYQLISFPFSVTNTPAPPNIMQEFFEGTNVITTFVGTGAGISGTCDLANWQSQQNGLANTMNADYTPAISGTKSLQIKTDTSSTFLSLFHTIAVPSGDDIYCYALIKPITLPSTSQLEMFSVTGAAGLGILFGVFVKSTGELYITDGFANASTVSTVSTGTSYSVWLHYNWVTTLGEVWFSSTGIKPANGSNGYATISSGTVAVAPVTIVCGQTSSFTNPSTGYSEFIIDRVMASTTVIGDNP